MAISLLKHGGLDLSSSLSNQQGNWHNLHCSYTSDTFILAENPSSQSIFCCHFKVISDMMLLCGSVFSTLYIKLAYDGWGSDQSWLVRVLIGMFSLVFTYHYMCFCLYTITCRSVKHNGQTHTNFNYCNIFSLAAILF